jgi:hypothetical protein
MLHSETLVWMPANGDQGLPGQVDWRNVDYEVMTPEGEILTQPQAYAR